MSARPISPAWSAGRVSLFVALLLAQLMVLVKPEILALDLLIDASSDEVHFVRGYLKAPATIDLTNVKWFTNEELIFDFDGEDYEDYEGYDSLDDNILDDNILDDEAPSLPEDELEDISGNNDTTNNNEDDTDVEGDDVDVPEKEEPSDVVIPSENEEDVSEQMEKEGIDSGNVSEPPEPETPGDDEGEPATITEEINDEVPTEHEEEGEEETANEDQSNNDVDEESETEEETSNAVEENVDTEENQQESETTPTPPTDENDVEGEEEEEEEGVADGEQEPADEEEEKEVQVEEESTPVTPAAEEDEEGNDEDNAVGDEEDEGDNVEEESAPETPPGDEDVEGGDEVNEEEGNGDEEGQEEEESAPETPPGDEGGDDVDEEEDEGEKDGDDEDDGNGGDRSLGFIEEDPTATDQILEVIVFSIPPDCSLDSTGNCDWVSLGVGSYDDEMVGEMSYCCSQDAAERNICNYDEIGTMMINHKIFKGDHRKIQVPSEPLKDFYMEDPLFKVEKSGDYIMVIANCNDDGYGVITLGSMEWTSAGGNLPAEIADFMFFMGGTSAIYLVLAIWYYCGMKSYQEAAIPIQKFILGTIIFGFLAHVLKSIDFLYWDITGLRSNVILYLGISFGILFQGSLRCLGVMVAMGWGVVRDSLGMAFCKIIVLGLLYSGLALLRESFEAVAMSKSMVSSKEEELFDLALVLVPVVFLINCIFYVWIIRSLSVTTEYLKNMNQTSKLRRHLRLRCLVITSLLIITVLTVVNAAERVALIKALMQGDTQYQPFLTPDQMWILKAVGYANHLFILFGVTILWRPNSDAKDYAMQMELPTSADDENDLELSCVVPSADDIDVGEGYKIETAVAS